MCGYSLNQVAELYDAMSHSDFADYVHCYTLIS